MTLDMAKEISMIQRSEISGKAENEHFRFLIYPKVDALNLNHIANSARWR